MTKSLLQRYTPLPIAAYLVGFLSIALLLFSLVGNWMLYQMDKVTNAAKASRQLSAQQEMQTAIEKVLGAGRDIGLQLAEWDETRQQLRDSTYYEYWRNTRALQTSRTPHYVTDLDIYGPHSAILQKSPTSRMPTNRPDAPHYLRMEDARPYLYQFIPLAEKGDAQLITGYLGMRIDFGHALRDLNRFIHIDTDSLKLVADEHTRFSTEEILQRMRFVPRHLGETSELEEVMRNTLYGFAGLAVLLIIIAYSLTSSLLHRPLRDLAKYIESLRRGKGELRKITPTEVIHVREFDVLRTSIINYQHELEQMHHHLDLKNKELWRLAHHDALTGVANRRAYDEDWMRLQELIRGQHISISVMLIDCDHFKAINDTYGHDVGDRVIHAIADCLKRSLREGDHLYRLGGDEFAMHLLNANIEQSRILAQSCQERLKQFDFKKLGIKEPIRFSIGIATAEGSNTDDLSHLHKQADIAMYQAKRPANNKIVVYHHELAGNGEALLSNRYISAVYQAIEKREGIELYYQPVVSADDPEKGFYEVLVRLRDERGLIMPFDIFPVVEAEGLAIEFDYAVLHCVTTQLKKGNIPAGTCISINIDGSTLMHTDFIHEISKLRQFIIPGCRCIVLEITENALITEIEEGSRKLKHLREVGFTIALDDFGSGYSSLRYLANMPVDIIKLDIGMVRDLEGDPNQQIITEHIAHMVRGAGYHLVAEGIETEKLLQRVLELGFTHAQGFLIDRPSAQINPSFPLSIDGYHRVRNGCLRKAAL